MARRKRKSDVENAVDGFALLPWQLCFALALIAGLGFHWLSKTQPAPATDVAQLGSAVSATITKTFGLFMQFLAPFVLCVAGLKSWLAKRRRSKLLGEAMQRGSEAPLKELTWREFEQLVAAYFERQGFSVKLTASGADGGVDVVARKGGEIHLIQCKQWRATKVGVGVVRELFGVMAAQGATGAYVVSIGDFTDDAKAFVAGRNIALVDANQILRMTAMPSLGTATTPPRPIKPEASAASVSTSAQTASNAPNCPKCGSSMVKRVAKAGSNAGQPFYGCSAFPKCRGIKPA